MRTSTDYVFFWGGPFSNFAPCHINAEGHHFESSEQYFMYRKAVFFKDFETAELILKAESPKEAKKLGRKVKGFDDSLWDTVKTQCMFDACYAKYTQNEEYKQELLKEEYRDKTFVEASPYDRIWGIGIDEDHVNPEDTSDWGQNLLGKTLVAVREAIISPK